MTATDGGARAALGMLAGVLLCYAFAALGWVGLPAQLAFIAVLICALWSLLALRDGRAAWMLGVVAVLLVLGRAFAWVAGRVGTLSRRVMPAPVAR
ncbi:MAG TPA: hypothetical protein DIW53_14480, partial [Achromobacter sp.]|nr:hypothetical protein [Achromobacter sp.]